MSHLVPVRDYSNSPDPIAAIHAARLERLRRMNAPVPFEAPQSKPAYAEGEAKPQPMRPAPRGGMEWSEEELETLISMAQAGKNAVQIGRKLRRSRDAVRQRAHKMGIVFRRGPTVPTMSVEAVVALYRLFYERPMPGGRARVAAIIDVVARQHCVASDDITGEGRTIPVVRARQHAMWLAARDTPLSLAEIGRRFNRDHTTVIFAVRRENERCKANVRGLGAAHK